MICCICGERFGYDSWGVTIALTGAVQSQKSGRPIPIREHFPDGDEEKFICIQCLCDSEFFAATGLDQQGYDFPSEEACHENSVLSLRPPHPG
jgi:hypothetical protein